MGRPVVLSNNQLFVGLDEHGLVHDFYYPYVGLENLTNARSIQHKIGIWVDGQFCWVDEGDFTVSVAMEPDALISSIRWESKNLAVSIEAQDYVDIEYNALIRHLSISNNADHERDIRVFMHQVFQLSPAGRADTALYVPDEHYILDYKGRFCLLIGGKFQDDTTFDQYAVGNYGIEGKAGTFLDAPDGELSGNAVEHAGVDSVLRFRKQLAAGQRTSLDYWIVAGSSQSDIQTVHTELRRASLEKRLHHVRQHWQSWLGSTDVEFPETHADDLTRSLLIIKAHCDDRGSILASGDSSIFNYGRDYYCYCWPRDASYALWPLIRLGFTEEAKQFFAFARDTMHPDGYLMHKYQPDRAVGSTWHPLVHGRRSELAIQEDETASVVFMIGEYFDNNPDDRHYVEQLYRTFVKPCTQWMASFIDAETGLPHASYDLWEEKFLTTTYTTSVVIAALQAAAKLATAFEDPESASTWQRAAQEIGDNLPKLYHPDGYFRKGLLLGENGSISYDDTVDISSLYGVFMFAGLALTDERLTSTARYVEQRIFNTSPAGGVIRYEHDNYFLTHHEYSGNPWGVTTLWLAQYYNTVGRSEEAAQLLDWLMDHRLPSGTLSEQYDPISGEPLGVTPLVWSHAELVNTLLDIGSTD